NNLEVVDNLDTFTSKLPHKNLVPVTNSSMPSSEVKFQENISPPLTKVSRKPSPKVSLPATQWLISKSNSTMVATTTLTRPKWPSKSLVQSPSRTRPRSPHLPSLNQSCL